MTILQYQSANSPDFSFSLPQGAYGSRRAIALTLEWGTDPSERVGASASVTLAWRAPGVIALRSGYTARLDLPEGMANVSAIVPVYVSDFLAIEGTLHVDGADNVDVNVTFRLDELAFV